MSRFALVSKTESLKLPVSNGTNTTKASTATVRDELTAIYEAYAEQYPNPRLAEEAHERDRLLRALAAAANAVEQNPVQKQKGFLASWFGSKPETTPPKAWTDASVDDDDDDAKLSYEAMVDNDNDSDSLCGTRFSLDASCIPAEAHSLARFHLASARTRGERPNAARTAWKACSRLTVVVGLGILAEFSNNNNNNDTANDSGRLRHTSDVQELQDFVAACGSSFNVAHARAATVGPNFLLVSWGLLDGFVVLYRRLTGDQEVAWEAVVVLGPTRAVVDNLDDVFLDEEGGSALLQITDIVPLVVEDGDGPPALTLAVARLGGFVELVPLSPRIWYGPEMHSSGKKRRKRRRQQGGPPEHYAAGRLVNIATNLTLGTVFATLDYHMDVIGLESFRTSVGDDTVWNREAYPNGPPAEYVLAASGTRDGREVLTFWSICFIFAESPEQVQDGVDFSLHASLAEAIDLGPLGADVSIFASPSIMSHWRQPKMVKLNDGHSNEGGDSRHSVPVTTVSASAPVVAIRFVHSSRGTQLAILDWNGGVTFMECSLLEQFITQNLTEEDYDLFYRNDDPEVVIPMVKATVDRSLFMRRLSLSNALPVKASSIQWSVDSKQLGGESMLAVLTENPGKLYIFAAIDAEHQGQVASVQFPTGQNGTIVGTGQGRLSFLAIGGHCKDFLSICAMDELEPRDIVESLLRTSKFKEVIEAAKLLSRAEQDGLSDIVDECQKRLWEGSRELESLESISDDSYVAQEALSLGKDSTKRFDMDLFQSIHSLALQRLSNTRLGPALAIGGLEGTKTTTNQIRDRLVKLGTYQLLCEYFEIAPSISQFCDEILPVPAKELAKNFAKAGDATALTVVCFRHRHETLVNFDVLDEIPVVVSPALFQHLFPVLEHKDSVLFLPLDSEQPPLQWMQMPQHLSDELGMELVLDSDDESRVLDHYHASLELESAAVNNVTRRESIEQWYIARLQNVQRLSGNLMHTGELSRLAMRGIGVEVEGLDVAIAPPNIRQIYTSMRCSETLGEMLFCQLDRLSPPSYATLSPDDIGEMELFDIVAMVLNDLHSSVEVFSSYKKLLQPFLDLLAITHQSQGQSALDEAIKSYCEGLVQSSFESPGTSNVQVRQRAIEITASIASLSRTSSNVRDRLVKNKGFLLDLVFATFRIILRASKDGSPTDLTSVVEGLWTMYESLPTSIPPGGPDSERLAEMLESADVMFRALVSVDILSRWPGCNPFGISGWNESLDKTNELCPPGGKAVASLCQSFCSQSEGRRNAAESFELSELLTGLLSDISELNLLCYGGSLLLSKLLFTHLLSPLMKQQQFQSLGNFLSKAEESWIDGEATSQGILSSIDEMHSEDGGKRDPGSAMSCLDILGRRFPTVRDNLNVVRRLLDATHFIRTVLLPGSTFKKFRPKGLRDAHPLDIIEAVLSESADCIVCDCREWKDSRLAKEANFAFRDFAQSGHTLNHGSPRPNASSLPPLPGRAIFHLARLLNLNDDAAVVVVKCRVIYHGIGAKLYGAVAAVCRTLVNDTNALGDDFRVRPILDAVASVVSQPMYADADTKRELCRAVVTNFQGSLHLPQTPDFESILTALSETEPIYPSIMGGSCSTSVERFCRYTLAEYSEDMCKGFVSLRQQATDRSVDDALASYMSRYALLWTITETNGSQGTSSKQFDVVSPDLMLMLASALLLHIQNQDTSIQCLQEVKAVLNKRVDATMRQQPPDFTVLDVDIVRRLVGRGYSKNSACRAAALSHNKGFDLALQWAVTHSLDPGFDDPIVITKNEQQDLANMENIERLARTLAQMMQVLQGTKGITVFAGAAQPVAGALQESSASQKETSQQREVEVGPNVLEHADKRNGDHVSRVYTGKAIPVTANPKLPKAKLPASGTLVSKAKSPAAGNLSVSKAAILTVPKSRVAASVAPKLIVPKAALAAKPPAQATPPTVTVPSPAPPKLAFPGVAAKTPALLQSAVVKETTSAQILRRAPRETSPKPALPKETTVAPIAALKPAVPNEMASAPAPPKQSDALAPAPPKVVVVKDLVAAPFPPKLVVPEPVALAPAPPKIAVPKAMAAAPPKSAVLKAVVAAQAPPKLRSSKLTVTTSTTTAGPSPSTATATSPDRSLLRERGQTMLRASRTSSSPATEERRRLIEEGRRLLQKARTTSGAPMTVDQPGHRYPLRSVATRPVTAQGPPVTNNGTAASVEPKAPVVDTTTVAQDEDTKDDAWDFDDF